MPKYIVLDLFSGAGGMAEGFIRAGFSVPYATDIGDDASRTYINRHKQLNKKLKFHKGDIRELANEKALKDFLGDDFDSIDLICGGPPCQGFSLAGKRDKNDPRNTLVFSYLEILHIIRPKYFVMENVVGLLSTECEEYIGLNDDVYKKQNVIDILEKEFSNIGYKIKYKILEATEYGVPQNRKRVIILGSLGDLIEPNFPKKIKTFVTVKEAIGDLEIIGNGQTVTKYNKSFDTRFQNESRNGRTKKLPANMLCNHQTSKHTKIVKERFKLMHEGENLHHLLARLSEKKRLKYATKKNNCIKLDQAKPSPTVTTLPDDIVHYNKNRILTVREMARLQSFDDSFVFLGKRTTGGKKRTKETPQYTQVGNAVPPLLAYAIAKEIMKALRMGEENE